MSRPEPPWSELDARIRETVRLLWREGFNPTDSGDGRKEGMECAIATPNVFMRVSEPRRSLVNETDRLAQLMAEHAVKVEEQGPEMGPGHVSIQASYDPVTRIGVIALFGVDDELLGLVPGGEQDAS